MGLYLKSTACFLLIVHAFHLASLQDSTNSPRPTIPKNWLRGELAKNTAGKPNAADPEETEHNLEGAGNNDDSGTASGTMLIFNTDGSEEDLSGQEKGENNTSEDLNVVAPAMPPSFPNDTTMPPELPDATTSPNNKTSLNTTIVEATNSSNINLTKADKEPTTAPQTSTTQQNSTSFPDFSNRTDSEATTTLAPGSSATQTSTTEPQEDTGLPNSTTPASTTSANTTPATNTTKPEMNEAPTTSSSTPVFRPDITGFGPVTFTTAAPTTPEKANKTGIDATSGSSSERGLASDSTKKKRNGAWGAVLGTAVAVSVVGLVAYIILKRKQQKGFSHRKLVDEFPSDPVLRLENSEPLDLDFGGVAYYNAGLQGDNIQMTNFPGQHRN
ncbi:mucin-15 [Echeneis naucrates]|uniref:Mucin 15, cell surface associated n=1 Tax=Echeneis naucrates TaxID=173247 RepID=A0A665WI94_ECHNA|nr:mucin-15 [Echeneis naucrates]XP_029354939.1 mucin-15 [Echeneis naucrates]